MREIKEKSTTFKFLFREQKFIFQKKGKEEVLELLIAMQRTRMSLTAVLKFLIKIHLHMHVNSEEEIF